LIVAGETVDPEFAAIGCPIGIEAARNDRLTRTILVGGIPDDDKSAAG